MKYSEKMPSKVIFTWFYYYKCRFVVITFSSSFEFSKFFFPVADDLRASSSIKSAEQAIHSQKFCNLTAEPLPPAKWNILESIRTIETMFYHIQYSYSIEFTSLHRNLNVIVCRQKYYGRHTNTYLHCFPISTRMYIWFWWQKVVYDNFMFISISCMHIKINKAQQMEIKRHHSFFVFTRKKRENSLQRSFAKIVCH